MYNSDALRQTTVHYDTITAVHHPAEPDHSELVSKYVGKGVKICLEDYFQALNAYQFKGSKFAESE